MAEEAFISGAKIIQTRLAICCKRKAVFRALSIAGKQKFAILALRREFRILIQTELLLIRDLVIRFLQL